MVTGKPLSAGDDIAAGRPLTEINGRPVFAMPDTFLFYRDLAPGLSGPDVRQLQAGLNQAGFSVRSDGITLVRQWVPVFNLAFAPAAVGGGILVGAVGGALGAGRASRIPPHEALRQ